MPEMMTEADRLLLDAAIAQAEKSRREGGIPIGSALGTRDGTVLAVGHNLRVQTGDTTAHAETVCLRHAGRRRDWPALTLATTLSPCAMCAGATVLHQIGRVVIGEHENYLGREDWLRAEGTHLVLADDERCKIMMAEFILQHPELWAEDIGEPA